MPTSHHPADGNQYRGMEYIHGKSIRRKPSGHCSLLVVSLPEPYEEVYGNTHPRHLLPAGHAHALPMQAALVGRQLTFEGSSQDQQRCPNGQSAEESHAAPVFACPGGELVQPVTPVRQRAGNEEQDILGKIAELKVVKRGAVGPGETHPKSSDANKGDKSPNDRIAWQFMCGRR